MLNKEYTLTQVIDATKSQINSPEKKFFVIKIILVLAVYAFLVLNSLHDFVSPDYVPECVKDEMHELTLPINQYLEQNKFYKNLLIIVASLMIDINVFVLAATWVLFGKSYKTFYIITAFYLFRAFLQSVFFLKFPSNYIWGHPGMFSITVPYHPANDFFYSGHLGLCTICYIHFTREKLTFMRYFGIVTIAIEFFTLLVTRAHYFIDLVVGMIVAHYIYLVADWVQAYLLERQAEKVAKSVNAALLSEAVKESQTIIEEKITTQE